MERKGKLEIEVCDGHTDRISLVEKTVLIEAKHELDYEDKMEESLKKLAQEEVNEAYAGGEEPREVYGKITRDNNSFTSYYGDINSDRTVSIREEHTTDGEDDTEEPYIGVGRPIKDPSVKKIAYINLKIFSIFE